MGSKARIAKYILPIIQERLTDYNIHTYIEPFCLGKDTIVFTENGICNIENIHIGDKILNEYGEYITVINKIKSPKTTGKYIKTKGNANFTATNEHIFYVDCLEKKTEKLQVGDSLDIGKSKNNNNKIIDFSEYITVSHNYKKGRSGKILDNNKIKLYHSSPVINRFIPITKELMQCYGLVVAEGDKSNITMHENEQNYLEQFIKNYEDILGIEENNKKYYIHKDTHSCQLAVPYKTIYERLFFQAMKINYGARNKNISFLFDLSNDMVLEALKYMYIGDGSLSKKEGKYRSLNYKTSSRTLAYQLQCLLSIKFGIKSTISHGMNKERYIDGRKLKPSDYYNISITRNEDIELLTGLKNSSININERTKRFSISEISEVKDVFYDITVDSLSHKFLINGGIITHNCGGMNMIDKVKCDNKIASDNNEYLIEIFKNMDKLESMLPEIASKEHYDECRNAYNNQDFQIFPKWYIGAIGFLASYSGRFYSGGFNGQSYLDGKSKRCYYDEAKRNLLNQIPQLHDIEFQCGDYEDLYSDKVDCLFYCDIPYLGVKQYDTSKNFDYNRFWNWAEKMSEKNIVLVSEYIAPNNWECIWSKPLLKTMNHGNNVNSVEKLFELRE